MNLEFYKSESTVQPLEVDVESSHTTVYIRRNIVKDERADPDTGKTVTVYTYDEAKIPKDEYDRYMQDKTQADIAYLYLMGGLDYE